MTPALFPLTGRGRRAYNFANLLPILPKGVDPGMDSYKINLSESEMPQEWYNIQPDLPRPMQPCGFFGVNISPG
jgi:hypothetical protein